MNMYEQSCFCDSCEYADDCEYAYMMNFCENCKDYYNCNLRSAIFTCKAGYELECNNGFEQSDEFD